MEKHWFKISYPEVSKVIHVHTTQIKDQWIDLEEIIAVTRKNDDNCVVQFKTGGTLQVEAVASKELIEVFEKKVAAKADKSNG